MIGKHKKIWAIALAGLLAVGVGASLGAANVAGGAKAAASTWNRVTSVSAGDIVTLVSEAATKDSNSKACTGVYMTGFNRDVSNTSNYAKGSAGTITSGSFSASDAMELTVCAGSATDSFAFKVTISDVVYYLTAVSGNNLNLTTTIAAASSWTIAVVSGKTDLNIANVSFTTRNIRWNNSSPRFAAYTSAQTAVQLYKQASAVTVTSVTGISSAPVSVLQNAVLKASDVVLSVGYSDSTSGTETATSVTCNTATVGNAIAFIAYYGDTLSASSTIAVYAAHTGLSLDSAFTCEEGINHIVAADLVSTTTYYVTGLYFSTYTAYNSSYKNMSVFLCDNVNDPSTRRLEAYRMTAVVAPDAFTQGTSSVSFSALGSAFVLYGTTYEASGCTYIDPDNAPLDSFVSTNMHMSDYTEELGYCKDSEHHYYSTAKAAYNALTSRQRALFIADTTNYSSAYARLVAWATANGESIDSANDNVLGVNARINGYEDSNSAIIVIAIVSLVSASAIAAFFLLKRRKEN